MIQLVHLLVCNTQKWGCLEEFWPEVFEVTVLEKIISSSFS
jgi:hypothetical protein